MVDSGRVWTQPDGQPCGRRGSATSSNDTAKRRAPIRLHDLRHVAATLMLLAGIDLKVVQETLGHSSWVVTRDTYTSVLPELAPKPRWQSYLVGKRAGTHAIGG
ncbi:tyrosine-type recombinase/integrase [Amycolatopsis sp. NPDC052450]|uniref:tyrosine-type recombinase/integrase n=1 Tax=Amycolatopsis sp. NPDC052450 TaxID=3363937 RepID=UPI0037CB716B